MTDDIKKRLESIVQKKLEELSDFWIKSPPPDLDSGPFGEPRSEEWGGSDTDDEICENDSDCPNCKVCNDSNFCVLSGECSNSAGCPTGQICEDCSCVTEDDETGACCIDNNCSIKTSADCSSAGGSYRGDNSSCSGDPCDNGPCGGPYDNCKPCTWSSCWDDTGNWICGNPNDLLCDRVQDGICDEEDIPCLVAYECDGGATDGAFLCEKIQAHWCATGELFLEDCEQIGPPCPAGPCQSNTDACFNCMFYATGDGYYGEGTMKSMKEICDIITTGGGYSSTAEQECFKAFMLAQGCGMDHSCENCENLYDQSCNCDDLEKHCLGGPIHDCACNNPVESCPYPHPLFQYPHEDELTYWSTLTGSCSFNTPSGLPAVLPCEMGQETANSLAQKWKECALQAFNRCQSLQQCMDDMPDATTCELINDMIDDNDKLCLTKACDDCIGMQQPSGDDPDFYRMLCWSENEDNCQEKYGRFILAGTYEPFQCSSNPPGGCRNFFCHPCYNSLASDPDPSSYCVSTEVLESCEGISIPVLMGTPQLGQYFGPLDDVWYGDVHGGSRGNFTEYWIDVVDLWCQTPEGKNLLFLDPEDNEMKVACDHRNDGWFGCNDTCVVARRAIRTVMERIYSALNKTDILCDFYSMSHGETIPPAELLRGYGRVRRGEMYTGQDWCNAQGQSQGSKSSTSLIQNLKDRLRKLSS